jgi:hypothetical protein
VNFVSFSITTVRAGMLMPTASVSVANTTLVSPSTKQASTTSLNGGIMPAWCAAIPRLELRDEPGVPEHLEIGRRRDRRDVRR